MKRNVFHLTTKNMVYNRIILSKLIRSDLRLKKSNTEG